MNGDHTLFAALPPDVRKRFAFPVPAETGDGGAVGMKKYEREFRK
jgi:hypothetical protein